MKPWTELTTLPASLVIVEIWAAEGLDVSPLTELFSALTDEVIALVWLGKSPLAELTSLVASLTTAVTCVFSALTQRDGRRRRQSAHEQQADHPLVREQQPVGGVHKLA